MQWPTVLVSSHPPCHFCDRVASTSSGEIAPSPPGGQRKIEEQGQARREREIAAVIMSSPQIYVSSVTSSISPYPDLIYKQKLPRNSPANHQQNRRILVTKLVQHR